MDSNKAMQYIEHLRAIGSLVNAALELVNRMNESDEDLKRILSAAEFGASRALVEQMERSGYIRPMRDEELEDGDFPKFKVTQHVLV